MSFEPPPAYLLRGRLNAILWRLPMPRRLAARLSRVVYRNPPVPAELAIRVVSTLLTENVSCWIRGGWGVDALVGRSTRSHDDLDVLVDAKDVPLAVSVLERLGFREHYKVDSDRPLFSRVVMRDHEIAGRTIDLQPIEAASMEGAFSSGTIDGSSVPCVSLEFQIEHRAGYRHRRVDREDLAVLRGLGGGSIDRMPSSPARTRSSLAADTGFAAVGAAPAPAAPGRGWGGIRARARGTAAPLVMQLTGRAATSLIVPVPSAQRLLDGSACVRGMPAHVTVMYPFLPSREIGDDARRRLVDALSAVPAFELTASSLGRFPNVVYLVPEPERSFLALTHAVMALWPQLQPFGGEFDEFVPHITVSYGQEVPSGVVDRLPIAAHVNEVWLMRRLGRGWVRSARVPLGAEGGDVEQ